MHIIFTLITSIYIFAAFCLMGVFVLKAISTGEPVKVTDLFLCFLFPAIPFSRKLISKFNNVFDF